MWKSEANHFCAGGSAYFDHQCQYERRIESEHESVV